MVILMDVHCPGEEATETAALSESGPEATTLGEPCCAGSGEVATLEEDLCWSSAFMVKGEFPWG